MQRVMTEVAYPTGTVKQLPPPDEMLWHPGGREQWLRVRQRGIGALRPTGP